MRYSVFTHICWEQVVVCWFRFNPGNLNTIAWILKSSMQNRPRDVVQAPVVQEVDNTIHQINPYPGSG